ncbi:hypothetical protein B9N43_15645 [Denitratisoma sp. DHT3]|uniref:DUF485 domain-containing protein n=1 Tax=Denitratisoma sp. DHT3 TaxID=1981880 RepID=UPI0011989A88|nr:DUF485 domain-containing protein [Denitratisoma sp. DHT3]QDX82542.1 hypothetical protein B9N43_15645 [Denitratisoma sp. DHT3]
MRQELAQRVQADPEFQELVHKKRSLSWTLTALMLVIYFGFVLLVALAPGVLKQSLSGGLTTVGIPMGIGVILSAFVLTGIYVFRANREFDDLTHEIVERATK